MKLTRNTLIAILLCGGALLAQMPPSFEVATVKPSKPGGGVTGSCHGTDSVYTPIQASIAPPLGRCVIHDARLSHLVNIAFRIGGMALIKSGPEWIARGDERFDVEAKAENPRNATEEQLLQMLQALLVERFQMKFHRDPIEVPGFAIVVAKNGPKLKATKSLDVATEFGGSSRGKPMPGTPTTLKVRKYSIARLAELLSAFGGMGPMVDKTDLKGEYDLFLSWDQEAGPTLAAAFREQLGLQLDRQKVQQSLFVIDSAHRPGAN
jgi:uncharacterized protein (TIGR03435 family)